MNVEISPLIALSEICNMNKITHVKTKTFSKKGKAKNLNKRLKNKDKTKNGLPAYGIVRAATKQVLLAMKNALTIPYA